MICGYFGVLIVLRKLMLFFFFNQIEYDCCIEWCFYIFGEVCLVVFFVDFICQMLNISNFGVKLVVDCDLFIGDVIVVDIVGIGFVRGVVSCIDESGIVVEFEIDF